MDEKAIAFVKHIVDIFGVCSCFDIIDENNTLEEEGLWFDCPECGEALLIGDDWNLDEVLYACPVCRMAWVDVR